MADKFLCVLAGYDEETEAKLAGWQQDFCDYGSGQRDNRWVSGFCRESYKPACV